MSLARAWSEPFQPQQPAADRARLLDYYDAWLFATVDATVAYKIWSDALGDERPDMYYAYVAALDREEAAAASLCAALGPGRARGAVLPE
jgi:hypothetical protein